MKKNNIVEVEIVDISHDGQGIGRTKDGFVVFVKNALPGEIINAYILKILKNKAFGKIKEIIKPSRCRIMPDCEIFSKCGGCTYQHTSYENELKIKQKLVKTTLKSVAGIDFSVPDVIAAQNISEYRNKMLMPVGYDENKKISAGFYRQRSHTIIPVKNCNIVDSVFCDIAKCVIDFMTEFYIEPYNEESHTGIVRHIFVRKGEYTGEIMVGIITNTQRFKNSSFLVDSLKNLNKNIVSIIHNVNNEKTNVILGKKTNVLYGQPYITDLINNIEFKISMLSFFQVNTRQSEILYTKALSFLDGKNDIIFDLYSGIGTIALNIAAKAKKVYGIESVQQAVNDANVNKNINKIDNVEFICGLAEKEVFRLINEGIIPTAVILDPPRSGCDSFLLDTIINSEVKKLIYISCNPATLARDIKIFTDNGYELKYIQPVDLFPRTSHVETIALLERR